MRHKERSFNRTSVGIHPSFIKKITEWFSIQNVQRSAESQDYHLGSILRCQPTRNKSSIFATVAVRQVARWWITRRCSIRIWSCGSFRSFKEKGTDFNYFSKIAFLRIYFKFYSRNLLIGTGPHFKSLVLYTHIFLESSKYNGVGHGVSYDVKPLQV